MINNFNWLYNLEILEKNIFWVRYLKYIKNLMVLNVRILIINFINVLNVGFFIYMYV